MAKNADNLADNFKAENTGGVLSGFLAEEDRFDRRTLWRLGSWAVGAVGAVTIAFFANQSSSGWRRGQIAAADLVRQSLQIQTVAKESQSETRRLASAIDTLNSDRDRLYSRVGVLEQGLDSVTGAIARQTTISASPQTTTAPTSSAAPAVPVAAAPAEKQPTAPTLSPVATTAPAAPAATTTPTPPPPTEKPSTVAVLAEPTPAAASPVLPAISSKPADPTPPPLMASKSMIGPPDPAAGKLIEPSAPPKKIVTAEPIPEAVASTAPAADAEPDATEPLPKVQRTEFGVDVGGANSVGGLRALWRGLLKSRSNAPLAALRPIIVVKESNTGLGMQLRLVAGPLTDAAAAAKICAGMTANDRPCQTTVFDGQRLAVNGNDPPTPTATATTKPATHRRSFPKHAAKDDPPPPPKPEPSTLSLIFGRTQ